MVGEAAAASGSFPPALALALACEAVGPGLLLGGRSYTTPCFRPPRLAVFDPWPKVFESRSARFGAIKRFFDQAGAFGQGNLYLLSLFGKSELEAVKVDPAHQVQLQQESGIVQPPPFASGGQIDKTVG